MPIVAKALLAVCLIAISVPAFAQGDDEKKDDEQSREEDLFGGDDDDDEAVEEPGDTTPEETTDDPLAPSNIDIDARLENADDPLAIGGRLYLRFNYSTFEDVDAEDLPLSAPALLDVYMDARPSSRVRAFAQARLNHDFSVRPGDTDLFGQELSPTSTALDQLWVKFDVQRRVFVTVGKQRIKWGAGRVWNPTDFLNRERLDPLALFDERLGVTLLKVHVPLESEGWNFYGIANLDGASTPQEVGGAFRAEVLVGTTEISASTAVRDGEPQRYGADVSTALWLFDVHAEAAVVHRSTVPYFVGELDFPNDVYPTALDRREDWIPQVAAGADITIRLNDEDNLILGGEYFFNDAGYEDSSLYPWLLVQGAYEPFYLGRHYASLLAVLAAPGNWDDTTFVLTAVGNLSDNSYIVRADYSVRVLQYLSLSLFAMGHLGDPGEFRLTFDVPPIPTVPGLENGITVPAPLIDVGVWMSLSI